MIKKSLMLASLFWLISLFTLPALCQSNSNSLIQNIMSQHDDRPLISSGVVLSVKYINENNAAQNYVIAIRYPQAIGKHLSKAAIQFNQSILAIINQQVASFKTRVADSANNKMAPNARSYLKINFQQSGAVSQSQHTYFLSDLFGIFTYVRGDAHPTNQILTFNYDMNTGKQLSLADLFKPDSGYLNFIANYSINQLTARKLPFIWAGVREKIENYENWSFNDSQQLVITFNEGQIAPRVYGAIQVAIPPNLLNHLASKRVACTLFTNACDGT